MPARRDLEVGLLLMECLATDRWWKLGRGVKRLLLKVGFLETLNGRIQIIHIIESNHSKWLLWHISIYVIIHNNYTWFYTSLYVYNYFYFPASPTGPIDPELLRSSSSPCIAHWRGPMLRPLRGISALPLLAPSLVLFDPQRHSHRRSMEYLTHAEKMRVL